MGYTQAMGGGGGGKRAGQGFAIFFQGNKMWTINVIIIFWGAYLRTNYNVKLKIVFNFFRFTYFSSNPWMEDPTVIT